MTAGPHIRVLRAHLQDPRVLALPGEQHKALVGLAGAVNWGPASWVCPVCHRTLEVSAGGTAKSVRTLAEEAGVSRAAMERALAKFGRSRWVVRVESARCHVIYALRFMADFEPVETAPGQHRDSAETAPRQKEEEIENTSTFGRGQPVKRAVRAVQQRLPLERVLDAEAWKLAKLHREVLLDRDPANPAGGKRHSQKRWAQEFQRWHEDGGAEGIPWDEIERRLRWALAEPYWAPRMQSPGDLASHWATIRQQMDRPRSQARPGGSGAQLASQQMHTQADYLADAADLGIPVALEEHP